jgi:hypothetical protein
MNPKKPTVANVDAFGVLAAQVRPDRPGVRTRTTKDHEIIQTWARQHQAEPATGEATESGPATVSVRDEGAGIRFNFPGFARFRPIGWDEWLAHFDEHHLLFVFEEQDTAQVAARAHERSRSHDGEDGRDKEDWLLAERDLCQQRGGSSASVRYHIVKEAAAVSG